MQGALLGQKFNPYHDKLGKFASGGGGGAGEYKEFPDPIKLANLDDPEAYDKLSEDLEDKLTTTDFKATLPGTADALSLYTSYGFEPMNDNLRGKPLRAKTDFYTKDEAKEAISEIPKIDSLLANSHINQNVVVFRGVKGDAAKNVKAAAEGSLFQDKGYVSTSISKTIASGHGTTFKIRVAKGANAYFERAGFTGDEWELILPKNAVFKKIGPKELEYVGVGE